MRVRITSVFVSCMYVFSFFIPFVFHATAQIDNTVIIVNLTT